MQLLKEGFRTVASAMIWTKEQKRVVTTQLSVFHEMDKQFYAAIPAEVDPDWFLDQLRGMKSNDCFFSVSLSRANIFFKAPCLGHDDGGFKFGAPAAIYKVQRRKDMRLMIPFGRVVRVEIPDPVYVNQKLSKKIFDISAGGLSFVVEDSEVALFQAGSIVQGMVFSIGSRRITVDAEVRHIKAQPGDSSNPGFKVGVLFTRIGGGDANWIAAYVFEESRKILSKFM